MKSQVLHTVWCNIYGEAAGENWHWSLLGMKGLIGRLMLQVCWWYWVHDWQATMGWMDDLLEVHLTTCPYHCPPGCGHSAESVATTVHQVCQLRAGTPFNFPQTCSTCRLFRQLSRVHLTYLCKLPVTVDVMGRHGIIQQIDWKLIKSNKQPDAGHNDPYS